MRVLVAVSGGTRIVVPGRLVTVHCKGRNASEYTRKPKPDQDGASVGNLIKKHGVTGTKVRDGYEAASYTLVTHYR